MAVLTDVASAEKDNLVKMEQLEEEALSFTANQLSKAITKAIENGGTDDIDAFLEAYTATYTNSMLVSWLLGQVHIAKQVEQSIELTNAPILLAVDPVPFQEAIDALSAMIPTDSKVYRQTEASMKLRAFTIANVSSLDAVNRVKKLYEDALEEGQSRSEVLRNLDSYLEQVGISESNPYWLELHYRNNMMTAYNSGRWTQIADNDLVEYLVYISVRDDGTTELCIELDGVVKLKTDDFWIEFYPPNHHKCRATVSALSRAQYEKVPSSNKAKSDNISTSSMHQNDTFAKEHQFRSSPLVSMQALPESLANSTDDYGLTNKVLRYSFEQSESVIQEQVSQAAKTKATSDVLTKAIKNAPDLNPFKERLSSVEMEEADKVVFGFDELDGGAWLPSLQYWFALDDTYTGVMLMPAFDETQIYNVKYYKNSELEKQSEPFITVNQ
ncbi:phage head morphogenesis protein [Vibrio campbellii]|uniref:phage head morphogenesis protein n=1 Tax=Vibrio campbellii TaxID=680 RepID=UPI001F17E871|nr:phage minor head protein [Vibrio campbellii]MCE7729617.1 phage head morphogenesis protein [Vibrio campbellii]